MAIKNRFEQLKDLPGDLDKALEIINKNIRQVAKETIGIKRRKKQPWISDDVLSITDERRKVKIMMATNPSLKPRYNNLTRQIRTCLAKCRTDWIEKQCHDGKQRE